MKRGYVMKIMGISSCNNLHPYPKDDPGEYLHQGLLFQKKMGFDASDISMDLLKPLGSEWKSVVEQALTDAQQIGLPFGVCHLPYGYPTQGTEEEQARFHASMYHAIDAAACLGVTYAVVHPNTVTLPAEICHRQAEYDSVMTHLGPYVEYACQKGLNLVVENMRLVPEPFPVHRYCQEPDELCQIADALGIGVCWDFGHAHINGQKQSEALSKIGSRLKVVHVNDNFGKGDLHLPPFCGTIDWKDAMKGLRETGFRGLFNYEISTKRIPASMRAAYAKYLIDAASEILTY